MLGWILQTTILSITFIWLVHYLFNYFKDTLTIPKVKDLVNEPNKKYKNMYQVIHREKDPGTTSIYDLGLNSNDTLLPSSINPNNSYKNISVADKTPNDMKNELKKFLKKQINK